MGGWMRLKGGKKREEVREEEKEGEEEQDLCAQKKDKGVKR